MKMLSAKCHLLSAFMCWYFLHHKWGYDTMSCWHLIGERSRDRGAFHIITAWWLSGVTSVIHFTNSLWIHNRFCNMCVTLMWENDGQIRSQFCTCHDSSAVVACAKLLSDWIIRIEITTNNFSQDFNYELINHLWNWLQLSIQVRLG